jgi:hypothetical protein
MDQPNFTQLLLNESKVFLTKSAIERKQFSSEQAATAIYSAPRTTLQQRRARIPTRRDYTPNLKKLIEIEELVILKRILDLDSRGFPIRYNFVKRQLELKARYSRKYDYSRAKNEDLVAI